MSFDVDRPPSDVFHVWTANFGQWWPRGHTVSGDPAVQVTLEPRVGGRIYEQAPDGTSHEWGEIIGWEPPARLVYLWHLRRDRADATEVEIKFVESGAGTRVEIEHRGWDRLGALGPDWRNANLAGWRGLLPHFIAACMEGAL